MIGAIGTISFAIGSAAAPPRNGGRLFGDAAAQLGALAAGRGSLDDITAALKQLRDALAAARDTAEAVPGSTALTPVTLDIAQTIEQPTFVTVNGQPVQNGTINVPAGTRTLIVGYARAPRAPVDAGGAPQALAGKVAALLSRVGTNGFAADVSALLRSTDLVTALNAPDAGAIDAAISRIDSTLAKAEGLRTFIGARASAAAQADLGGLLLGADAGAAAAGGGYRPQSSAAGTRLSAWA